MMRLIDADELKKTLGISGANGSCKECSYYGHGDDMECTSSDTSMSLYVVCSIIDDAPNIANLLGYSDSLYHSAFEQGREKEKNDMQNTIASYLKTIHRLARIVSEHDQMCKECVCQNCGKKVNG